MNNAAKQRIKQVVAEEPLLVPTKWARVAIYGSRHISEAMAHILSMCLCSPFWEDGDHGIRALFIGEFGLKGKAEAWPEVKAVAIDLKELFDLSIERCQTTQVNSSIFSWYTLNMVISLFHEAHHTSTIAAGSKMGKDEELKAEKFAHEAVFELGKTFHIEPADWTSEPFFHDSMLHATTLEEEASVAGFIERQLDMLDNRLFFHLPRTEEVEAVKCHSFKEYLCMMETGKVHDESWLGTPIPVAPIAKVAADINPDMPATEAVAVMGEQAGNIVPPAEATPPVNIIALGPSTVTGQEPLVAAEPVDTTMDYDEDLEDMDAGDEYDDFSDTSMIGRGPDMPELQSLMDARVDTVTVPNTGGAQQLAPASGAPGTPFVMNGQQVGTNVVPDALQPAANYNAPPTELAPSAEVFAYPPTSMDDQTLINVIQGIYAKCYDHIFSYCGQNPSGFSLISKVYELQLELTPQEAEAVVAMDCLDPNGRWCPRMPTQTQSLDGTITARLLGFEMKNTKLPCYKLYINANGKELCRLLMPQNPLKQNNGQFSKPALAAQAGARIMYVKEGNDAVIAAGGRTWCGKFVDGRWEA